MDCVTLGDGRGGCFCEGCLLEAYFANLQVLVTGINSAWDAGWLVACRDTSWWHGRLGAKNRLKAWRRNVASDGGRRHPPRKGVLSLTGPGFGSYRYLHLGIPQGRQRFKP
jgi:hypothetical protein